jgi:hypothetical protein
MRIHVASENLWIMEHRHYRNSPSALSDVTLIPGHGAIRIPKYEHVTGLLATPPQSLVDQFARTVGVTIGIDLWGLLTRARPERLQVKQLSSNLDHSFGVNLK